MTITIKDKFLDVASSDGEAFENDGATFEKLIETTNNETEADVRTALKAGTPTTYLDLIRDRIDLQRTEVDGVWEASVSYVASTSVSALPKLAVGDVRWSITAGSGGTAKRTFSKSLVSEVASSTDYEFSGTAAELALGLKNDKGFSVEGIDVPVGSVQIQLQAVRSAADVTAGFLNTLSAAAVNKVVNSLAWNNFPAGTLQIVNTSANERAGTGAPWDITATMDYQPNLTSISVGNGLTVTAKDGHDELDVLYVKKVVGQFTVSVPVRAAVHRLFDRVDFATVYGF